MQTADLISSKNLLEHSFYRRWATGELSLDELRDYAGQYAFVVRAMPEWLRLASTAQPGFSAQIENHAIEEEAHVPLWARFAQSIGVSVDELASTTPNQATSELLRQGSELAAKRSGLAVAWALEAQAPAVSAAKLRGLADHYGIDAANGGDYFALHQYRDVAHSRELGEMIATLDASDSADAQAAVEAIDRALWDLLTSVEAVA
jgi:pyrroloquinoline-quinone synthase